MLSSFQGRMLLPALLLLVPAACGSSAPEAPQDLAKVTVSPAAMAALQRVAPRGPLAVGRTRFSPDGAAPVWLYYPASGSAKGEPAPDGALPQAYGTGLARRFGAPAAAALLAMPGHAQTNAPVAEGRFPLIVFNPGANMGGRDYRLLVEEIASHGYIVAVLNLFGSPPVSAGRYAEAADEMARAVPALLDWARRGPIGRHVEPGSIGFIGHSLGGGAAVLALSRTPGFAVAVDLDGDFGGASLTPAPARPILYLIGRTDGETEASEARRMRDWATVAGGNPEAAVLQIDTLRHFDFADATHLPGDIIPENRRNNRFGSIGGARAHAAISGLVLGFLDEKLRRREGALASAVRAVPEAKAPKRF